MANPVTVNFAHHGTLTPNTPASVKLNMANGSITVINRVGIGEIYWTIDGSTPSVLGDDTFVVANTIGAKYVVNSVQGACTVNLISSGSVAYSVIGGQA